MVTRYGNSNGELSRFAGLLCLLLTLCPAAQRLHAQSPTAGPLYAGAVGTNGFTTPGNAVGSEQALCATRYGTSWSGFWNSFGFAIPSGAQIDGIRVEIMQRWRDDPPGATSLGVVIGKNETTLGTEKRGGAQTNQQTCDVYPIDSYGGSADLWGLSWTAGDINSPNFTVRIRNADGVEFGVNVNWIRVTVTYTLGVTVTPDGAQNLRNLPSNGTNYTATFTVTNSSGSSGDYDLLASKAAAAITIVSVNGVAGDSTRITGLAAGASQSIDVVYSIGNVATGTADTLRLRARLVTDAAITDAGFADLVVVRPNLSLTKSVSPGGASAPGTDLTYTMTFTNVGSEVATNLVFVDSIPSQVDFKVGSVVNSLPAGISVAVDYSNDGGSTWIYVPAGAACGAPAGYDRCADRIRWRLLSSLGSSSPDNTGTLQFIAAIR